MPVRLLYDALFPEKGVEIAWSIENDSINGIPACIIPGKAIIRRLEEFYAILIHACIVRRQGVVIRNIGKDPIYCIIIGGIVEQDVIIWPGDIDTCMRVTAGTYC